MVRYYGLYANAHRGKVGKADRVPARVHVFEQAALMAAEESVNYE
jgi:hypothetical protein